MTKNAVQSGAPALDKGLDLLEALASASDGLNQKQLAERVGRSVNEVFRMLVALEQRGYIARDPKTGEYTLTLKLFRIASQFPPTERLLQAALPIMEQLARRLTLSCHLSVLHGEQFMVIARNRAGMADGLVGEAWRRISADPAIRFRQGTGSIPARRETEGTGCEHCQLRSRQRQTGDGGSRQGSVGGRQFRQRRGIFQHPGFQLPDP